MELIVNEKEHDEEEARGVEPGNSLDRATASSVRGSATARSDRFHAWPANRRTEEVIAERMLMAALLNYRRAKTGKQFDEFKTHDQMTDIECGFYEDAVKKAYDAIWGGK